LKNPKYLSGFLSVYFQPKTNWSVTAGQFSILIAFSNFATSKRYKMPDRYLGFFNFIFKKKHK